VTDQPPPVSAEQDESRYVFDREERRRHGELLPHDDRELLFHANGIIGHNKPANTAVIVAQAYLDLKAELQAAQEQRDGARDTAVHLSDLIDEYAEALQAAQEREKGLREVAHQIVGLSRTVGGEHPTVQAIAANASRALLPAQRTEEVGERITHGRHCTCSAC